MKFKVKKIISLAVSTALVVSSIFIPKANSQAATGKIDKGSYESGKYGSTEEINYLYYKGLKLVDSFLILDGKGEMPDIVIDNTDLENGKIKNNYELQGWVGAMSNHTEEDLKNLSDDDWLAIGGELDVNDLFVGGEITSIGENTFYYHGGLITARLGKNVTKISKNVFLYCMSLTNLYIYGDDIQIEEGTFDIDFPGMGTSMTTIHVVNQNMADKVAALGVDSSLIKVDISVDDTALRIALKKAATLYKDGTGYTTGTWKALTDAVTDGQACYEKDALKDGLTDQDVTAKAKAIDDAMKGLVSSKALDDALAEAAKLEGSDYTAESWAVLEKAVEAGKTGLEKAEITGEEITTLAKAVTDAIAGLVKLTADVAKADLAEVVAKTEGLVESDYSKKSWETLQTAIAGAEAVADSEVISEIAAAAENLQKALDGLVVEYPEEWFSLAGIPSSKENYANPVKISILSGKVDADMDGATKVEVTFDCASDTSYNPYTAINLELGSNYKEFKGTDDKYVPGTKGWKETLELSAPLRAGDAYNLTAFTQNWADAAGNVFTIQAVRFLDADDIELKAVSSPKNVAEFLASSVKDAEEKLVDLEAGDYTEESIADFKAYLESLKSGEANQLLPSAVNAILTKLEDVTTELQPSDNTTEMETLSKSIEKAEALNKSDYTATSWSVLEKALTAAKKATGSTVISEVKALNQAVEDAIAGLKPADPNETPDPNKTPDPNETPDPNKTPDPNETPDPNQTQGPNKTPDPTKVPTPTKNPGGSGTTKPTNPPSNVATGPKVGTKLTSGSYVYQVTKAATAKTEGTVTFTSLSKAGKKASKLSIPDTATISGYKYQVTKLGNNAFKGAKAKSISLGKYITVIPKGSFVKCTKLKTLSIKAKLKSVKKGAFKGCKKKIKVKTSKKYKKANMKLLKKSGYKKFK